LQLQDSGRPIDVDTDQHDAFFVFVGEPLGKLGRRRCLTGALQARQQNDHRRLGLEVDWREVVTEQVHELGVDDLYEFLARRQALADLLAERFLANALNERLDDRQRDVRFEQGQADLRAFFNFHPWLYLFLVPAIAMRLWAEERKSGSVELLMTLPVTAWQAVSGKFLAAWAFTGIALGLTFPIWITVNYLGDPDNGAIAAAYIGSLLMAGGFLAIGSCLSAVTRNQVIAFVITIVVCFGFLLAGFPMVLDMFRGWAPEALVRAVAEFSFLTNFQAIAQGVIDLRDVIFFASLIGSSLVINTAVIELKKGG